MDETGTSRVQQLHAALAIGILAMVIAIPALILAALHTGDVDVSNTQNIAGVPGQTDITGNLNVSGTLNIPKVIPSSSSSTGSLVVGGGVGVGGSMVVAQGVYTNTLDTVGPLHVGTTYQTALNLGRTGIPVQIYGNRCMVENGMETGGDIIPDTTELYSLGGPANQWDKLYMGGVVYNPSLFPTQVAGGIYSMTSDGPLYVGAVSVPVTILGSTGRTSFATPFSIPANSMQAGDAFNITASGSMSITAATSCTVVIGVYIDGVMRTEATFALVSPSPNSGFWNFQSIIDVRNAGVNGTISGSCRAGWNTTIDQDVRVTGPVDTTSAMSWDVRVSTTSGGGNLTGFRALQCNMWKVY